MKVAVFNVSTVRIIWPRPTINMAIELAVSKKSSLSVERMLHKSSEIIFEIDRTIY